MIVNVVRFLNNQLKFQKFSFFIKLFTKAESGNVDNYD